MIKNNTIITFNNHRTTLKELKAFTADNKLTSVVFYHNGSKYSLIHNVTKGFKIEKQKENKKWLTT